MATLNEKMTDLADKFRHRLNRSNKMTLDEMTDSVDSVHSAGYDIGKSDGKQAEYDRFWDKYQQNGDRTGYNFLFAGTGWNDETYSPKYPIVCNGQSNSVYQWNSYITSTKVPITFTHSDSSGVFHYCTRLKEIVSLKVTEAVKFSTWFGNCSALETINFTDDSVIGNTISFSSSTKLSHDSIVSIINALSTTTSELKVTLSKAAVNSAFETSEGANDGASSEEWAALIATKTNWTISLV